MLNWVQIRTVCRPFDPRDSPRLEPLLSRLADVNLCVILLEMPCFVVVRNKAFLECLLIRPSSISLTGSVFIARHNDELAPPPLEDHSPDHDRDIRLHVVSEVYETLIELLRRETEYPGGRVRGIILARTLVREHSLKQSAGQKVRDNFRITYLQELVDILKPIACKIIPILCYLLTKGYPLHCPPLTHVVGAEASLDRGVGYDFACSVYECLFSEGSIPFDK